MSGVFLTVWDFQHEDNSPVLKTTRGGYPHFTLFYSGKHEPLAELLDLSHVALKTFANQKVTLTKAYVNSFFHEGEQKTRYDVLLDMDEESKQAVTRFRNEVLASRPKSAQYSMNQPHVTHKICWSEEEAKKYMAEVSAHLPAVVEVNGVYV